MWHANSGKYKNMKSETLSRLPAKAPDLSTESLVPLLCWPPGLSSEVLKFRVRGEQKKMRVPHLPEPIIHVKVRPALQRTFRGRLRHE